MTDERASLLAEIEAILSDHPVYVDIAGGSTLRDFDVPTLRTFRDDMREAAGLDPARRTAGDQEVRRLAGVLRGGLDVRVSFDRPEG